MSARDHALPFQGRLYRIAGDFAALLEIEDEIGSIAALYTRLNTARWTAGEVVTAAHVLLSHGGCACDYMQLGAEIEANGFERYRATLVRLLAQILDAGQEA